MPDPAATPQTPAPDPAQPDLATELASTRVKLTELQTREGRFRNEKGVMQARIRELEQLALGNQTDPPEQGQPTYAAPQPQFGQPPQYQPAYSTPQDVVTREEWDLDRFKREAPARFEPVRTIAMDPVKVGQYIRYRPGPYGQAVPDVYGTYKSIADSLELAELRAAQAGTTPGRNPALGIISGTGAASLQEQVDINSLTPEQIREQFPDAIQTPLANPGWGR